MLPRAPVGSSPRRRRKRVALEAEGATRGADEQIAKGVDALSRECGTLLRDSKQRARTAIEAAKRRADPLIATARKEAVQERVALEATFRAQMEAGLRAYVEGEQA